MRCLSECVNPGEKINLLLNLFIWQSCRDRIKNEWSRTCHINTRSHFFCCHRARQVQEMPVECSLSFRNAILILQSHSERGSQRWLAKKHHTQKNFKSLWLSHLSERDFYYFGIPWHILLPSNPYNALVSLHIFLKLEYR